MVSRIGLVVALACVAVPATLMGSTWYFIKQNPALDTASSVGDTAIWCEDVIQINGDLSVGDSTPITPDSFVAITAAGLDSLGLLTGTPGNYAVDSEYSAGRIWKSWLTWGTTWYQNKLWKVMTGASGTYRTGFWGGYLAVTDSIYGGGGIVKRYNPWKSTPYDHAIVVYSRVQYPTTDYWLWQVWGTHSWGSDWQHSYISHWY